MEETELSEAEEALLARAKIYREEGKPRPKKKGKISIWARPILWISVFSIVPIIASIAIITVSSQVAIFFDNNAMQETIGQIPIEGMEEIEAFAPFYESRYVYLGAIWTIYILLFAAIALGDYLLVRKRKNENKNK